VSTALPARPRLDVHPASLTGASSLRRRFLGGAAATLAGHAAAQALRFGANLVLARLLVPEHFGLMLAVTVLLQGLQMFSDIGLGPAIIRHARGDDRPLLDTAWTLQVIRGFALWAAAAALAWPCAALTGKPEIFAVIPVAGVTAAIAGLNSTAIFQLSRRLRIGKIVVLDLVSQGSGIGVMIGLALAADLRSVWALVVGAIAAALVKCALSHRLIPAAGNRPAWDSACARDLLRFGRWVFVGTAITFLAGQADRIIPAAVLPSDRLGVYAIASALALVGPEALRLLASRVLYPVLAELHRRGEGALRRGSARVRLALLAPGSAALLTLASLAEPIVAFLYPPAYADAGWMLRALTLGAIASTLSFTYHNVFFALGATRLTAALLGAHLGASVLGAFAGATLAGEAGLIWGLAAAHWAVYPLVAFAAARRRVWQPAVDLPILALSAAAASLMLGAAA
jgi:O-antigen/teichoic acid export membrane protein